ncbi:MAG: hypothetical protein Q4C63_09815 [Eubacteriales bacterium]|nr:hypothetical protein [Eubacteriales bacterium]
MRSYNEFKFKYQRYAIRNLSTYVSILFAVGYLISLVMPQLFNLLVFMPREVMHGQVWRIVTTVVYPPVGGNVFWAVLGIYVYYNMATSLEHWWGSFNFNVYFFSSVLVGELGTLIFYLVTGFDLPFIPVYMYFSVFMAYAITFPGAVFLLFFVLPVKAKYLAVAEAAIYLYNFITGGIFARIYILCALIPVAVYFFVSMGGGGGNPIANIRRKLEQRKRRKEWQDQWR